MRIIKDKSTEYDRCKIVNALLGHFTEEKDISQQEILENWLNKNEKNKILFNQLNDENYIQKGVREFQHYNSHEGWQKVKNKIHVQHRKLFLKWSYAASIIILLGIGIIIWNKFTGDIKDTPEEYITLQENIAPGNSRAILILESGETIFLGKERDSLTRSIEGENFVNNGEQLVYSKSIEEKANIHTLQIPQGGEYTLCLSDGTTIILNANSKIQYPDRFSNKERWVELEGEAYFNVAKNSHQPFVVRSFGTEVRVLGTSFNMKSYRNEPQQTTLVEGEVEVISEQKKVKLTPGEQAIWEENNLCVRKVNPALYIAWTKQRLVFDNEPLEGVMRILQRWYSIDIQIEDPSLKKIRFTADLPRYEYLTKILNLLEMTTNVKFELNKNVLTVKKE